MILTVILGVVNLVISAFMTHGARLPGFDITPVGTIIIAMSGENAFIGAIVLSIAYMLPSPGRFVWLIPQVPGAFGIAWLAVTFNILIVPILIYYVFSAIVGAISGGMSGRYVLSIMIGLALNIVIGRIYGFFI